MNSVRLSGRVQSAGYMNWHGEFENKDFDPNWVVSL